MKLTAFFLFAAFLNVSANVASQNVTLSGKKMPLERVFQEIKEQTGYFLLYPQDVLEKGLPVNIEASDMPLNIFLKIIFKNQPLGYVVGSKTINVFLSLSDTAYGDRVSKATLKEITEVIAQPQVVQDFSGRLISAETKEPIAAASIIVKQGKTGTSSGSNGRFSLTNLSEDAVIVISSIGYSSIEVSLSKLKSMANNTPLNLESAIVNRIGAEYVFELRIAEKMIDMVQVTAYGKTTKRFATGSIGTVRAEEIERQPVMNVLQALEGKVPGLVITPTSGNSAAPVKVEIRGRNSLNPDVISEPLYVVDGVALGTLQTGLFYSKSIGTGTVQAGRTNTMGESPLLYLNPRDIESINVLKDADATALYGARGANGVILITTKSSKSGPSQFQMSIQRASITIPQKLDLLGTEEYLAVRREAFKNDGISPTFLNAPDLTLWDQTKYTDWQQYFYKPGSSTTVNASVSGGMAQTTYRIATSYSTQDQLNNNGGKNNRATLSSTVTHSSVNQKFQVSFSSQLAVTGVEAIDAGGYTLTAPNAPDVYNVKGEFNFEQYNKYENTFPFASLKQASESRTNNLSNSLKLNYQVIKGLNLSVMGAYNFGTNDNARYQPLAAIDPAYPTTSQVWFGKSTSINWSTEPQIAYNTFIGKGNLSVQVGGSLQHVQSEGLSVISTGFTDDNLLRSSNNAASSMPIEGSGEYRFNAAFGVINYRWDNKYVVNLNGRRDGSTKFGPGNQFGSFGSVGLAWIASEEKWMKKGMPSWFSFLKFSGSYGITGSDAVGDYEYLTRFGSFASLTATTRKLLDYNGTSTMHMLAHTNKNFRWESTKQLNTSLSVGLIDDIISIEATYYQSRSGDQLVKMATPFYTGFSTVRSNWGAVVQNHGVELSISASFLKNKDWNVSGSFNTARNRNKLIEFPGLATSPYWNQYEVGKSMNLVYLFKYTGIHPMTGDYTFEDHNKDGSINFPSGKLKSSASDDRYIVYDLNDKFNGGMGLNISYKSFGLFTSFVFRNALARDPFILLTIGSMKNLYMPQEVKDNHWQQPGDIAKYPKYTTGILDDARLSYSDAGFQNASFLQMNNLSLSYSLPKQFISKIKMKGCSLSVNTQNLFTITSFKGIDPKIISMVNGTPTPRTIALSINFNF